MIGVKERFEYSTAMKVARTYMNSQQIINSINKLRDSEEQQAQNNVNEVELVDDIFHLDKLLKTKSIGISKESSKLSDNIFARAEDEINECVTESNTQKPLKEGYSNAKQKKTFHAGDKIKEKASKQNIKPNKAPHNTKTARIYIIHRRELRGG